MLHARTAFTGLLSEGSTFFPYPISPSSLPHPPSVSLSLSLNVWPFTLPLTIYTCQPLLYVLTSSSPHHLAIPSLVPYCLQAVLHLVCTLLHTPISSLLLPWFKPFPSSAFLVVRLHRGEIGIVLPLHPCNTFTILIRGLSRFHSGTYLHPPPPSSALKSYLARLTSPLNI